MASELLLVGEKVVNQQHWENKSPINDHLRTILAQLTNQFNHEAISAIQRGHYMVSPEQIKDTGVAHTLPYGRLEALPPAVFGDISKENISLEEKLIIPTDDDEIERLADMYVAWGKSVIYDPKYIVAGYSERDLIVARMKACKGEEYALDKWQASAGQIQQSMRDDRVFLLDVARNNRLRNASSDYDQLNDATQATHRPYESSVVVMSNVVPDDKIISNTKEVIQMPVGQYGEESARKLAQITVALNDYLKSSRAIDMGIRYYLDAGDEKVLAEHTARSRERYEGDVPDFAVHGLKNTLAEGILSMAQVISLLTAEKVEGYDTHDELVAAILDSDVIEQFTRLVRPGYIGPTTLAGVYLKDALAVKNGKLSISKEAVRILNEMRREYRRERIAKWAMYDVDPENAEHPSVLALPCPAANPNGSITTLKSVFKEFYSIDK